MRLIPLGDQHHLDALDAFVFVDLPALAEPCIRVRHQSARRSFSRPVVTGNMNDCAQSACIHWLSQQVQRK